MLLLNSPTFGTVEHRWSYNSLLKFSLKLNRYFFFSFLFLINNRIVSKEKKQGTPGVYMKNSKVQKRRDLRSEIDRSFP